MHNKENPVTRQRKLHFEDDELWTSCPSRCRNAAEVSGRNCWRALLKKDERRQHERED